MQLLTPMEAAKEIGVSLKTVQGWIRRAHDPLPSVAVGASGKHRRVLADMIFPWLEAEAERNGSVK